MYEQSLQLNSQPFTAAPFVKHYYPAQMIQKSLASARLCIDRGSGPVMIIGEAGTGKSLLLAMLEEQYRPQFSVVNLACARLDERQELLQNILFELQLPYRDLSEGELRLSLMDYLKPSQACPNGLLLLVDEAQNLPVDLLDEIRLITNFVREGLPRVRLVICGNQRLEERLAEPKMESFSQRIAARCYLSNLSQAETADYVVTHIDRAGGDGKQLFEERSLRVVHELSEGCPRYVNQLCDHILILASTQGVDVVGESLVREAWADVQCLPGTPMAAQGGNAMTGADTPSALSQVPDGENWTVIEFGELEDDADATLTAGVSDVGNSVGAPLSEPTPDPVEEYSQPSPVAASGESLQGSSLCDSNHVHDDSCNSDAQDDCSVELETCGPAGCSETDGERDSTRYVESDLQSDLDANDKTPDESPARLPATDESPAFESTPAMTLNPFLEEFEQEEEIADRYAPLVAAQNKASLELTKSELQHLAPLDEPPCLDAVTCVNSDQETSTNLDSGTTLGGERISAEEENLDGEMKSDEGVSAGSEASEEEDTEYHTHLTQASQVDAARQAEQLIESLRIAQSNHEPQDVDNRESQVNVDDEVAAEQIAVSHETGNDDPTNLTFSISKGDSSDAASTVSFSNPEETSATKQSPVEVTPVEVMPVEVTPVEITPGESNDEIGVADFERDFGEGSGDHPADDQDMLVLNISKVSGDEGANLKMTPPTSEPMPFPATPVSTGQAKRMDYQALFDQLRNSDND